MARYHAVVHGDIDREFHVFASDTGEARQKVKDYLSASANENPAERLITLIQVRDDIQPSKEITVVL